MCDLTKEFKLCSCDGEKLAREKIDWTLQRKDDSLSILYRKGRAAIPQFSEQEAELKVSIIDYLNKNNCFDFEFEAQEDDFLRIRINKKEQRWAAFRFVNGQWINDKSTSLDGWRSQLTNFESGKIKQ